MLPNDLINVLTKSSLHGPLGWRTIRLQALGFAQKTHLPASMKMGAVGHRRLWRIFASGPVNRIPVGYVDNCAEAIVPAGVKQVVIGEVCNAVDHDLPSRRRFLRAYMTKVRRFRSIYVPHALSYLLCCLWEKYSGWSEGQLPPIYGRGTWHAFWKKTRYSNQKLKRRLGWEPRVPTLEALDRFFESCRKRSPHA